MMNNSARRPSQSLNNNVNRPENISNQTNEYQRHSANTTTAGTTSTSSPNNAANNATSTSQVPTPTHQRQLQAHPLLAKVQSHLRSKVNMLRHHKNPLLVMTVNGKPLSDDVMAGEGRPLHGRVKVAQHHRA